MEGLRVEDDAQLAQQFIEGGAAVGQAGKFDSVTIHIDSWNFSAGTHTISVAVEVVPGDRNPNNNAISNKFFASAGPPKVVTVWSPAFWVALVVVGVAGVGAGWLVAIGQRRREHEAAEIVRSRQEPRA